MKEKTKGFLIAIVFIIGLMAILFTLQFIKNSDFHIMKSSTLEEIKYNYTMIGANTIMFEILIEVAKCEPMPIVYQNQTYNLILMECFDLNINQGGK